MNFKPLNVLVAIGMAALIARAVYQAGPGAVAPQIAEALKPPPVPPNTNEAIARGIEFLRSRQSPDGAWRSDVYATFKDGTALTPLVIAALQAADGLPEERKKAAVWLAKMARADGTIDEGPDGLPYPVYTAALSTIALTHPENSDHLKARDAWRKYLLDRQLTEQNGWSPEDKQYGGWGYYPLVPTKPAAGRAVPAQNLLESNLSATTFALDAIHLSESNPLSAENQKRWERAIGFVKRCRNADGGFHFVYDDPVRNKAGGTGEGFHSYGSASADGERALYEYQATKGATFTDEGSWLRKHFEPDRHPGVYVPTHEPDRNAVYFYYVASASKTLLLFGVRDVNGQRWRETLASALAVKQRPDGSWANPVELVRENDPILATAYAVFALGDCRRVRRFDK